MYVYNLINFIDHNSFWFTDKGKSIRHIASELITNTVLVYADVNPKTKKVAWYQATPKIINFNNIPDEFKALFYFYKKDINAVKKLMSLYKWKQFLNKYGETL